MAEEKESLFRLKNFINNEFVEPARGKYLDNYDPSTGDVYSFIPDSHEEVSPLPAKFSF
jgi:hypothetical protein